MPIYYCSTIYLIMCYNQNNHYYSLIPYSQLNKVVVAALSTFISSLLHETIMYDCFCKSIVMSYLWINDNVMCIRINVPTLL